MDEQTKQTNKLKQQHLAHLYSATKASGHPVPQFQCCTVLSQVTSAHWKSQHTNVQPVSVSWKPSSSLQWHCHYFPR